MNHTHTRIAFLLSIGLLVYHFLACGRTLQEPNGQFSSPAATNAAQHCQWRISATHGEKIYLNITSLEIPYSDNCENSYLDIKDGHFNRSRRIGKNILLVNFLWIEIKKNASKSELHLILCVLLTVLLLVTRHQLSLWLPSSAACHLLTLLPRIGTYWLTFQLFNN